MSDERPEPSETVEDEAVSRSDEEAERDAPSEPSEAQADADGSDEEEDEPFRRYRRFKEGEYGGEAEPTNWADVFLRFRWPVAMVAVAVVGHMAYVRSCRTVAERQGPAAEAVTAAGEAVAGIAERFRSGRITTTFTASIPRLVEGSGMALEVAVLEGNETFQRTDERRVLFDLVNLGTTESEIRVPVTYRYHVRLDGEWQIDVEDGTCIVRAPPIRPSQPPAIHTDRMEKRSTSGWLRFDADEQMEALERSITPTLEERAAAPEAISLVREHARGRVAEFIRNWLLIEDHWREDRFRAVVVVFADEGPVDGPLPEPSAVLIAGD